MGSRWGYTPTLSLVSHLPEMAWDWNLCQGYPLCNDEINVTDCVIWLLCNLQTRDRFLNISTKNENDFINQFFFVKETYFRKFQSLIMSLIWETKELFWNAKYLICKAWVIWAWAKARRVCGFDMKTGLRDIFPLGQMRSWRGCTTPPSMYKRLKASSCICEKQSKYLFAC